MITGFQFNAAMASIKLNSKEAARLLNMHEITLIRYKTTPNLEKIKASNKNNSLLIKFFQYNKIFFPTPNSIEMRPPTNTLLLNHSSLTRFQFVVARSATKLTQKELGEKINLSYGGISLFEAFKNTELLKSRKLSIPKLKIFFEHAGIIFNGNFNVAITKDPSAFFKKTKIVI